VKNEFRFRAEHRLRQEAEYKGVFAKRRVLRGELRELYFGPSNVGSARLGVVIPKRNAALAVTRNYCKRLAREWFRHRRTELPALDLVVRLAKSIKAMNRDSLAPALREDFDMLLKRLPQ
jgi:ribonuclease P protein component